MWVCARFQLPTEWFKKFFTVILYACLSCTSTSDAIVRAFCTLFFNQWHPHDRFSLLYDDRSQVHVSGLISLKL